MMPEKNITNTEESLTNSETGVNSTHDSKYWYLANTTYGEIYVGIYRNTVADGSTRPYYHSTILEIVKTLSREEALIRLVEDWLNIGLNLKPFNGLLPHKNRIDISLVQTNKSDISDRIILSIADSKLESLPKLNDKIKSAIKTTTTNLSISLILSENTITISDGEEIKTGNIILLPESFEQLWVIGINPSHQPERKLIGYFSKQSRTIKIDQSITKNIDVEQNSKSNQKNYNLSAIIKQNISIPISLLFGWTEESYLLQKPITSYKLEIQRNSKTIAEGHLLPISFGYGVYIDKLY
jgi:hypothetical protein